MTLEAALRAAGCLGVERVGEAVFARDGAEAPEFRAEARDGRVMLTLPLALRATDAERADWMRAHPRGRLEIVEGETQLSMVVPEGADLAAALQDWLDLMRAAMRAAVVWRRRQKPLHGM
ncbi:MAG: hypothetical protein R3D90_13365 [Paracoccaceae bacterium]